MPIFRRNHIAATVAVIGVLAGMLGCTGGNDTVSNDRGRDRFRHVIVDANGPLDPWGKSLGDLNGDGFPDLIVGGFSPAPLSLLERVLVKLKLRKRSDLTGTLVWYENPTWRKTLISDDFRFSTDHETADVNGDGRVDLISLTDPGLVWFRNPDWAPFTISLIPLHDIEIGDFDKDGDIDIVGRNQTRFGHNDGNRLHFFRQDTPHRWRHWHVEAPHGEGLKTSDMNSDGYLDVLVNGRIYTNPGILAPDAPWRESTCCRTWERSDAFIDVADIDLDGHQDIVLAPSEPRGERYRISWCEAPASAGGNWRENVIDGDVETVHHFVAARDLDNDGRIDVVTAQMHQGADPDDIAAYWNRGGQQKWRREVIAETGSHSMRAADIDRDGDIDLFGANWSGEHQEIELWVNQTLPRTAEGWKRHVLDASKPWRSIFVASADLDRDGHKDVITGGWWYRNPGDLSGTWRRIPIGGPASNMAVVMDIDSDGDPDVLASRWKGGGRPPLHQRIVRKLQRLFASSETRGRFVWARNDGSGNFDILDNLMPAEGDFLQGTATVSNHGFRSVVLSWHEAGHGIQAFGIPEAPASETWPWRRISDVSQDEALSSADLDRDGDTDLVLGTKWLRNEGGGRWSPMVLHAGPEHPDRNRIADINGDGRLDVVIGYEAISTYGEVAWYEQGADPAAAWTEHHIGTVIGPMSLGVGDVDGDYNLEVVVGEHNLKSPETSRLLIFDHEPGEFDGWEAQVVHTGDEHHDGAHLIDIDDDGDLDIVSIGWGQPRVLLYENRGASN